MIDTFTKLKKEGSKYGLLINEFKMKYIKYTRMQVRGSKLEIDSMSFKSVRSLSYLWSVVNQNITIEKEIKERLAEGNNALYAN
jgi:hypothetical protein